MEFQLRNVQVTQHSQIDKKGEVVKYDYLRLGYPFEFLTDKDKEELKDKKEPMALFIQDGSLTLIKLLWKSIKRLPNNRLDSEELRLAKESIKNQQIDIADSLINELLLRVKGKEIKLVATNPSVSSKTQASENKDLIACEKDLNNLRHQIELTVKAFDKINLKSFSKDELVKTLIDALNSLL